MVVLGISGLRRCTEASTADARRSKIERAKEARNYFDLLTTFGAATTEIPINYFPVDGVGHDAASAIIRDGNLVAAASEERFNRMKHSTRWDGATLLPQSAIEFCLHQAAVSSSEDIHVAFYCDFTKSVMNQRIGALSPWLPPIHRDRVTAAYWDAYEQVASNVCTSADISGLLGTRRGKTLIHHVPHHLAHAASAFYGSGFAEAGILTMDASGEKSSSIFAIGNHQGLKIIEETLLPHSIGMIYLIITAFLGFQPLDGEYKVMGLASYGDPKPFRNAMNALLTPNDQGVCETPSLVRADFSAFIREAFGEPRVPGTEITTREMNIAAALQASFEVAMLERLAKLRHSYGIDKVCIAGGCALNSAFAGRLARSRMFRSVYISPASGDDGASIGAAQYVSCAMHGVESIPRRLKSARLGPSFTDDAIQSALDANSAEITYDSNPNIELEVASLLATDQVVGWFQGRMEFGPRALGSRSILADPRCIDMRNRVNRLVKRREEFRPFAPSVVSELASQYFDTEGLDDGSPFMQFVVPARPNTKELVPAIIHCDGSARVQTVDESENPLFWRLLHAFGKRTGIPILLNTSFNVRDEPIVCTPHDAVKCFLSTQIDYLAIGNFLARRR